MFDYELNVDLDSAIPVGKDQATIVCGFRHSNETAIRLKPGKRGEFNVGFRVYSETENQVVFEDRMEPTVELVEPGEWVECIMNIPRPVIDFEGQFLIIIDMVKEFEYWFSVRGGKSHNFPVTFADAALDNELVGDLLPIVGSGLAATTAKRPSSRGIAYPDATIDDDADDEEPADPAALDVAFAALSEGEAGTSARAAGSTKTPGSRSAQAAKKPAKKKDTAVQSAVVFDVSDLIQYFWNARLPTGIQRVQIEIINNVILSKLDGLSVKVACFTRETDFWVEIPPVFFNALCKLSLMEGNPSSPDWLRALERLKTHLQTAPHLVFPTGAYLVNLGTSWWLQNYFLNVRAAKAKFGIKYVPFVHDCIPVVTPEHCVAGLTRDFITWVLGAFQHADHVLVNSEWTARDVKWVARHLGHKVEEPVVIKLDADYRRATAALSAKSERSQHDEVFTRNGLRPNGYVLFVSTIESRKNHLLAFSGWLNLLKRFGPRKVPKLVCVGNNGWLNSAVYEKLSASELLRKHVVMLSKIPDLELAALYENCLFTLYPSSYEGWGLPVTEALCYGKVPLLADSSSLPEAGGKFGDYFSTSSEGEFIRKLERLIFDDAYRSQRERVIAKDFKPRLWSDIAKQVVDQIRTWARTTEEPVEERAIGGLWPFPVKLGRYYGLTENLETHIWRGMVSGEIYRQGDAWWWCEPWGCWTKAKMAQVAFLMPIKEQRSVVMFLGLRGVQNIPCTATVAIEGIGSREIRLGASADKWTVFRLDDQIISQLEQVGDHVLVQVMVSSDRKADFRTSTDGADTRIASVGVLGFMVCEEADAAARIKLLECIVLDDFGSLTSKPLGAELLLAAEDAEPEDNAVDAAEAAEKLIGGAETLDHPAADEEARVSVS